jgi:hypothetical protein
LSIFSTILVFVIIPLGVIVVVAALVTSSTRRTRPDRRYRPGRPHNFKPVWYLASPAQVTAPAPARVAAGVLEDSSGTAVRPGSTGGASDRW